MGGIVDAVFGGGGSAPAAPDYTAAARETAKNNMEMAKYTTNTNRVNQSNPFGSLSYSYTPQYEFDKAGYQAALDKYKAGSQSIGYDPESGSSYTIQNGPVGEAPKESDFMKETGRGWSQTVNFSPEQQQLYNKQMGLSNQYADLAAREMSNVMGQPSQQNTTPPWMRAGGGGGIGAVNIPQAKDVNMDLSGLHNVNDLSLNGLPQAPINAGTTAQQAMLSRLNPQMQQYDNALAQRLANQGITLGSEAYNREMNLAAQRRNDLELQAAAQGISLDQAARQQALGEQQALFNSQMGQRQQGLAEQQALANVGLTQRGQDVSSATALGTAGISANASLEAARMNAANQYDIANRGMAIQEKMAPINYINALRAGSQYQTPQFNAVPGQANVAGADILGATTQGYNAQLGAYNAQNAQNASLMSGLFGLGGAALMSPVGTFAALSDIRAKENIQKIGSLENGLGVYEYTYKPEFDIPGKHIGVMAQEVIKVKPEAIVMRDDGYMAVNYAMI